ncbi:MAG: hypothetical protein GKC10_08570 [Methanosarcinales archaeon]|nr:hypothetical protein [Methanosarcinales archaeon]
MVTFDPKVRLSHMDSYIRKIHQSLPPEEARIQLLRCRLVGYKLVAELAMEGYTRATVDDLMAVAYENLSKVSGIEISDPYLTPCESQYSLLEELKSYPYRDQSDRFMTFIKAEFKKVFIPTLRLMTELCHSENKYSWEEVESQLEKVMVELGVEVNWPECDSYLENYLKKVSAVLNLKI